VIPDIGYKEPIVSNVRSDLSICIKHAYPMVE
jgi:hypothetical protein